MGKVPITVMGYRCERCDYEWIPRALTEDDPKVCPRCKSPYWNRPKKENPMTYDEFKDKVVAVLKLRGQPMTWTEVRTQAGLPQKFPNNQWVHRMETQAELVRIKDAKGIMLWTIQA